MLDEVQLQQIRLLYEKKGQGLQGFWGRGGRPKYKWNGKLGMQRSASATKLQIQRKLANSVQSIIKTLLPFCCWKSSISLLFLSLSPHQTTSSIRQKKWKACGTAGALINSNPVSENTTVDRVETMALNYCLTTSHSRGGSQWRCSLNKKKQLSLQFQIKTWDDNRRRWQQGVNTIQKV